MQIKSSYQNYKQLVESGIITPEELYDEMENCLTRWHVKDNLYIWAKELTDSIMHDNEETYNQVERRIMTQVVSANSPYGKFLKRLQEIREYEWNAYDIKIYEECNNQKGVRKGETALEAIARNMVEVLNNE